MTKAYDAVIIGAGIIGCSTAFELVKTGLKTLNIDKLSAAGNGSTANSCAVIRVHYSTLEGTAVAYEGYHYWNEWEHYLGVEDPLGSARFFRRGILVFKSQANQELKKVCRSLEALDIVYQNLDLDGVKQKYPLLDYTGYFPPRRPKDDRFGVPNREPLPGAIYYTEGGYVSDPVLSTHNLQVAAEALGAQFRFNAKVVDIMRFYSRLREINEESSFSVLG
jgi:sarcosine oxidase subunit beta